MNATIPLGRLRGVPIGAHWSVLVILALVADVLATSILPATVKGASGTAYWSVGVVVAVAFLLSLVAHEAAHAIVARRAGMTVRSITLWMLGGVTVLEGDPPDARSDLRIAVAGPAVSFVCAVISAAAGLALRVIAAPEVLVAGFVWLAVTNSLLAVFNLLPGAPLDGGRVLRAFVWRRTGDRDRAELVATRGGRATGLFLIWLGIAEAIATANLVGGLWFMLIGWFLMSAATVEQQASVGQHALEGLTVAEVMQLPTVSLPAYQEVAVAARRVVDVDEDYFPVSDFEGHPVGIVSTEQLVGAIRRGRGDVKVMDVAVPLTPAMTAAPDDMLIEALRRGGVRGLLAVVDDDRLVGIVTPIAVNRALRKSLVGSDSGGRP